MIRRFNASGLKKLNGHYKVDMPPVSEREFSSFLVPGRRPATAHAAEFIEHRLRDLLKAELKNLNNSGAGRDEKRIRQINDELNKLHAGTIREKFLDLSQIDEVPENIRELPGLMQSSPAELAGELRT